MAEAQRVSSEREGQSASTPRRSLECLEWGVRSGAAHLKGMKQRLQNKPGIQEVLEVPKSLPCARVKSESFSPPQVITRATPSQSMSFKASKAILHY